VKRLKRLVIALGLLIVLIASFSLPVLADSFDEVTVTATPSYISILNSPDSQGYGVITASSSNDTDAYYFTITNSSTVTTNVSIWAGDFTGGTGWTLSDDGSIGADTAGMYAGTVSGSFDTVVKASPGNVLKSSLASSTNISWHLRLNAPSSFGDGAEKSSTVTVSAAA